MRKIKPSPPQKKEFFDLLDKAVRKGEKAGSQRQIRVKGGRYSERRIRPHKTGGASRK